VTVTGPTEARPSGGLTIDFVVVPDRAQLSEVVQRVRVVGCGQHWQSGYPRRCRRRLQPDRTDQGKDDSSRSSVRQSVQGYCCIISGE